MNFSEAMKNLKQGLKVTRKSWGGNFYFILENGLLKSYKPMTSHFIYDESIMMSTGWLIDDDSKEYVFCEIIPLLQKGAKAKLKEWNESFIYYDETDKALVTIQMGFFSFMPQFSDFLSQDWIIVE